MLRAANDVFAAITTGAFAIDLRFAGAHSDFHTGRK
jgi:hypothetical protein